MRHAIKRWTTVSLSGALMLVFAGSLMALDEGAGTSQVETGAIAGIQVLFKMDPRLSGPTYGGEHWFSPPTFTSAAQEGTVAAVDVRVQGIDARGRPLGIVPEWTASDPDMVTVTPGETGQFRITVQRTGESRLKISSQGVSKELVVKAKSVGKGIQVEISQTPAP